MDRVTLLRAFARVVDGGSLTQAARELGVRQSTVSKWVAALEEEVGVPLLHRTTRSLRATDAGERLLPHARALVERWEDAVAEAQSESPRATGCLRVSVPAVFGVRHVVPHLPALLHAHPDLTLDPRLADRYVTLLDEGLDVAIRVGVPVDSVYRARRLGGTRRVLVASPAYLERRGTPVLPPDLEEHDALVHSGVSAAVWRFRKDGREIRPHIAGRAAADHSEALRELALGGLGVALLAAWLVDQDLRSGRLVELMPGWSAPDAPIRALLPPARRVPARVRVFLEHLEVAWQGGPLDGSTRVLTL